MEPDIVDFVNDRPGNSLSNDREPDLLKRRRILLKFRKHFTNITTILTFTYDSNVTS